MKFAFLFTQLEIGGVQTRVMQTATELRKRGHEVDVFALYQARPCFEEEEKTILSTSKKPLHLFKGILRFWGILRQGRYDVLITNTAPANIIGNFVALLAGLKKRISWQTQPPQRISKLFQRLDHLMGWAGVYTTTVANSHWTRSCFQDRSAKYRKRMKIIMNGISPRVDDRSKAEARAEIGLEPEARIISTVGRLSKQKGQVVLLEALQNVPDVQLFLIGDGELKKEIQETITTFGLSERVFLVGEIPGEKVATYLRASDIFAFPSRWETFGLAVIEAAASGVPLVSSDLDVLKEVLSLEDCTPAARMVAVDDPKAWARALNEVLNDGDLRRTLAERSIAVSRRHSLESHVDNIIELAQGS